MKLRLAHLPKLSFVCLLACTNIGMGQVTENVHRLELPADTPMVPHQAMAWLEIGGADQSVNSHPPTIPNVIELVPPGRQLPSVGWTLLSPTTAQDNSNSVGTPSTPAPRAMEPAFTSTPLAAQPQSPLSPRDSLPSGPDSSPQQVMQSGLMNGQAQSQLPLLPQELPTPYPQPQLPQPQFAPGQFAQPQYSQPQYPPAQYPAPMSTAAQGPPQAWAAVDPACLAPGAVSGVAIRSVPYSSENFLPTPLSTEPYNPREELATYRCKSAVPVQRPWVEFWRPFYTPGIYPPAPSPLGKTNLLFPHFYVYGDYRTGVGVNRNQAGKARSWAHRLNLDMDLQLTATERIHGFMGPLDKNGAQFTRMDFSDDVEFEFETDARFDTLFFEGDVGAIAGGLSGIDSAFDLPFTFGLVPLLYQNGIWMEDAVLGAAFAVPSRHSSALHWSNFDATFFAAVDQITSDAFAGSNSAAEMLGTAWFIEAYDGYFELDYAYIHDDVGRGRSYNNFAVAFTRRYLMRLSNSVRFITNFGQDLPDAQRTADGYLLLVENSLISASPNTFVPYCNLFYGSGRPQSAARAAGAGGILRNTGINFETDALTGYPTLDPTAANAYGAALGVNMLGANFSDQLVLEAAALGSYGSDTFRRVIGDQYALGVRYQRPLSHRWIFRTDSMVGFLRNADDIVGNRVELRWKF